MSMSSPGHDIRIGYQAGESPWNNVIQFLERHVQRFPDRVALRWVAPEDLARWDGRAESAMPHRGITYADFLHGVRHAARGLQDLGIARGDRVVIFLPMGVGMYTALFAVQRIGAIAVFLDSWARRHHLGASAACVGPKAMISHRAAFDLIRDVPEFASMPLRILAGPGADASCCARLEALLETPATVPLAPVEPESTALITFTTGSSGVPKGANRTHRFLAAQHEALSSVAPYEPTDSDMPAFPIFSLNNLASGVATVLPAIDLAAPSERDPAALASQILGERITCATLSPAMLVGLARFCDASGTRLESLRRVITGGAPISRDHVRDFKRIAPGAELFILYGSTEVEPMAHIEADEMLRRPVDPDPEIVEDGVNVGHVSADLRHRFIRIVDGPVDLRRTAWKDIEVPRGEVGEFVVAGDHVCRDYYNNRDAFRASKIEEADGTVWHRTGDLARLDEDGYLWVVGRVHNAFQRAGSTCFPVRAEGILERFPFVRRGAFLGLPDPRLGERAAVVVELDPDAPEAPVALREIRRVFEKNRIPIDSFYVVDRIPLDPRHHSKVEYALLRTMIRDSDCKDHLDHA